MHPASEKGHMIVSHREQSCSVQKTSWGCLGCHFVYVVWFYHVRFFFCSWESHRKSPVAVAFSVQLKILCTYPVLWQLYICESEERILKQILYFLQSDIVLVFFPLIVAWKIKVFGNMLVEFFKFSLIKWHTKNKVTYHILLGVGTQQCLSGFVFYQQRATAGRNLTR